MSRLLSIAPFFALFCLAVPSLAASDPLPTYDDMQKAYAAGDHQKALQMIARVLILKGEPATAYNKHALLQLKGEAHLRLKAIPSAIAAFADASKAAPEGAEARDMATQILLRKLSPSLTYQPKAKDKNDKTKTLPPMNVLEAADRKKAIEQLFADELAAITPAVEAAIKKGSLPTIMDVAPALRATRWLELASTGRDVATKELTTNLRTEVQRGIDTTLAEISRSNNAIEREASTVTTQIVEEKDRRTGKTMNVTKYSRKGLTKAQVQTLKESIATCKKIFSSTDAVGTALGDTGKELDLAKEDAERLGTASNELLERPWFNILSSRPR